MFITWTFFTFLHACGYPYCPSQFFSHLCSLELLGFSASSLLWVRSKVCPLCCAGKSFFNESKNVLYLEKHSISSLHVNNLTFRWNAARKSINSTLNKKGDRSIWSSTGSAHTQRNSKWATCSSCALQSSGATYIGTQLNLHCAGRNILLLKTTSGSAVYYKNLSPPCGSSSTVSWASHSR